MTEERTTKMEAALYSTEAPGLGFYEMQIRERALYKRQGDRSKMHFDALGERQKHWWKHYYTTYISRYDERRSHEAAVERFYDEGRVVTYLEYQGDFEAKKVQAPKCNTEQPKQCAIALDTPASRVTL